MSELALKLIKEAKEKRLTTLDLSICELTELPDELFELTWLKALYIRPFYDYFYEREYEDYEYILNSLSIKLKELKSLERLDVSKNRVLNDFMSIKYLKSLKWFIAIDTNFRDLRILRKLSNLEYLYISNTNVQNFNYLKELVSLKTLFVNDTSFQDISLISTLKNLQNLDISYTYIYDLSSIQNLNNLIDLNISSTIIEDISPIKSLQNLQNLNISHTRLKDFTPIKELPNLKILNISYSKIFDLKFLNEASKIEVLNISSNEISDLSPVKEMLSIKRIEVSHTKISDLNPLKDLIHIEELDICHTLVTDLSNLRKIIENGIPVKLEDYDSLYNTKGIFVKGCHLINPPIHIVEQGNEAILRYWHELENKETITNNQTKLIFVGNSRAGKTSLWQYLKDNIYPKENTSTFGIKNEIWDCEEIKTEDNQSLVIHIWDFGGQEFFHATHRLFLSENAIYIIVWEEETNKQGTRPEKIKFEGEDIEEEVDMEYFSVSYWSDNIKYYGGEKSKILILQNKVDNILLKRLHTKGRYDIANSFHVSIANAYNSKGTDNSFSEFRIELIKVLKENATAFKLVKYYAQVREALEAKAKNTEYIAVSELKDIALQFDETPDLENLLAYLKSFTNTVLYFPQNDVLKDRLYLNPTHISRDIYKILNKQVRENNGKFDVAHIKTRLNLTDDQEAERFVALMREFDLIFEKSRTIKGIIKRQFITPQYLPKKEDLSDDIQFLMEGFSFETAFMIQFKSFVPRSLMLRFIANNGALSNQETYWRNGIIYKSPTTQLMIKVEYDHEALTFTICVQYKAKQTIDMQNIVEQFVKLENSDDNIKISNDGKTYVDLRTIRKLQHENSRGDIYENGELIPLSKFDWLTQKIEIHSIMDLKELKNTVHGFIAKAKTKEAMEAVATWAHANNREPLKSDINQLKGELVALDRQETLGLLSFQEVSREKAKLNHRLMSLMNGIDESSTKDSEGIRVDDTPTPPVTPQVNVSAKLKILMLTANPANTAILNMKKEHSLITLKLQNTQDTFNLILREAVSASEFKEFIETEQPAILHFSGHGEGGKDGGIVVQNDDKNDEELISIDGLDALFEYLKDELNIHIKAVLLNACYSEEQALTIAKYVDYVVGTTVELGDDLAIAFSTGYYFKLATSNLDFELSFKSGRTQAVMKGASKSHFVLYKNGAKSVV